MCQMEIPSRVSYMYIMYICMQTNYQITSASDGRELLKGDLHYTNDVGMVANLASCSHHSWRKTVGEEIGS